MERYFVYLTDNGPIYIVEEFSIEDGITFPRRMYEYYTKIECFQYFNYLGFEGGKKYLKYGDLSMQGEDLIVTNKKIVELDYNQLMCATYNYLSEGKNPLIEALRTIVNGLTKGEADEALRRKWESMAKSQENKIAKEKEVAEVVKRLKRRKTNHEIISRRSNTNITEDEKKLKTFMYVFGDLFEEEKIRY